ncbi:MAG: hypothetical protein MZV70_09025 [Desulfobacterales bacterium]|nr:hypothetical protein [Desulfobacterales bacterium]
MMTTGMAGLTVLDGGQGLEPGDLEHAHVHQDQVIRLLPDHVDRRYRRRPPRRSHSPSRPRGFAAWCGGPCRRPPPEWFRSRACINPHV